MQTAKLGTSRRSAGTALWSFGREPAEAVSTHAGDDPWREEGEGCRDGSDPAGDHFAALTDSGSTRLLDCPSLSLVRCADTICTLAFGCLSLVMQDDVDPLGHAASFGVSMVQVAVSMPDFPAVRACVRSTIREDRTPCQGVRIAQVDHED